MESLDSDGDGTLSRGELAVFLASPAASAADATGAAGAALRTALLTRFAGHAGASLVRRASSEGSVEPVKPDSTLLSAKTRIGHHDAAAAPLGLKVTIRGIADIPDPPAGLPSGKGVAVVFNTFDDADVDDMCERTMAQLESSPPPLPPGATASVQRVTIEGDTCVAIYVDAPMLNFPPELGMMFGVGDLAAAFEGFHYDLEMSVSKSVDDIVHSVVPIAEGLTLESSGSVCIPKHVLNVVLNIVKLLGAGSPFASMLPPGVAPAIAVYASMFKILDKYVIEASLDSASEAFEMARTIIGTMPPHVAGHVLPAVELAANTGLGERHAEIVSSLAGAMDDTGLASCKTLKSLRSINAYMGPLGLDLQARGMTIPYMREAAELCA